MEWKRKLELDSGGDSRVWQNIPFVPAKNGCKFLLLWVGNMFNLEQNEDILTLNTQQTSGIFLEDDSEI